MNCTHDQNKKAEEKEEQYVDVELKPMGDDLDQREIHVVLTSNGRLSPRLVIETLIDLVNRMVRTPEEFFKEFPKASEAK